jgi:hypothetical protein
MHVKTLLSRNLNFTVPYVKPKINCVRFEVFTALTMKNVVVDATLTDVSEEHTPHIQSRKIRERGTSISKWLLTESAFDVFPFFLEGGGSSTTPSHFLQLDGNPNCFTTSNS